MTLKSILTASVAALALTIGSLAASGDALAQGGETPPLLAKAAANQPGSEARDQLAAAPPSDKQGKEEDDDDDDDEDDDDEEDDDDDDDEAPTGAPAPAK